MKNDKDMKIHKCCSTCEFNFSGRCANEFYGLEVEEYENDYGCSSWEIGLDYYSYLMSLLPKKLSGNPIFVLNDM